MQKVVAFIQARTVLIVAVIIVVTAFSGFIWLQNGNGAEELLAVQADSFIQEVSVSGKVVAVDDVDLGFIQGGRVEAVYAIVGDRVGRGRVLAELQNDDARALVLQRRAALSTEQANLQSLLEGTREEELAVSRAAVTSAEVTLSQATQSLLEAIQDAFRAGDNAVRVQVDQFISNPRNSPQLSFNTSNSSAEVATETKRFEIESVLNEWESDVFTLTITDDLDAVLITAKANLNQVSDLLIVASAAVSQGVSTGSVTSAVLETYASDVATARSAISTAITALTSAETAQKSAVASLDSAQKSLTLLEAGATASSVAAQEAKVEAARAQVLDAEAKLNKTFIAAPFDGVLTKVEAEAGETVAANQLVVSLISDDVFQIESFVPEINIALLKVDDVARVTLDAYGENTFFPAVVSALDPAETIRDGVSTYRAVLEFTEDDDRVKAGMTANVVITTAEKENVIAVPQGIVESKNGKQFVPVREDGVTVLREVTTGLISSSGTLEITSGLNPGDVVVLSE